jgi:hypothetical protein
LQNPIAAALLAGDFRLGDVVVVRREGDELAISRRAGGAARAASA